MSCDCIEKKNEELARVGEVLKTLRWYMRGDDALFRKYQLKVEIATCRAPEKRGRPHKYRIPVTASFCPFCGKKYYSETGEVGQ